MPGEVLVRFYEGGDKLILSRAMSFVPPKGDVVHFDGRAWLVRGAEWHFAPDTASVAVERLETEAEQNARLERERAANPKRAEKP